MSFSWRLSFLLLVLVCLLPVAHAASWEQPAADIAKQIAALTGPGPARLVIHNNSTLATGEIPAIRRLLERDLRSLGVLTGGSESATLIRVTLSENLQGGLWVAEIQEGTETRIVMVPVPLGAAATSADGPALTLRRTLLLDQANPILDARSFPIGNLDRIIVLEPEAIAVFTRNAAASLAGTAEPAAAAWSESQTSPIPHSRPFPRDIRGRIFPAQDHLFDAFLPGVLCTGSNAGAQLAISCADSDDPWPVSMAQRAFYNSTRNYFSGILAPGVGMDLQPFYTAADLPRPTGSSLLLNTIDGRVILIENNVLKPIAGANDWGSDFAVLRSSCGSGAQLLVSGSGSAAAGDSLRAWEISGREAIPASAPMPVEGAVTSIAASPNNAAATVIVRRDQPTRYEVWNVAALCN